MHRHGAELRRFHCGMLFAGPSCTQLPRYTHLTRALVLQSVTVESLYAWTGAITDDSAAPNVAVAISSGGSGGTGASTMTFSVTGVT